MTWFVEMGYDVFAPVYGNAECDFIGMKDGRVKRVQVKCTNYLQKSGKYQVELKSTRSNKTANVIKKFDASLCDYLVVYFEPLDALGLYRADVFDGKTAAHMEPGCDPDILEE